MELSTEQLDKNIDYKEEKLKCIIASLTKLSGSETASTNFVKSVEANVLDKGVNNGNIFREGPLFFYWGVTFFV